MSEDTIKFTKDLSWGDTKKAALIQIRIKQGERDLDSEMVEKALNDMNGLMSKMISYIPPSWLVHGAPENLDWSKPESFDYVKQEKINEINLILAGDTEEISKN